jgi:hypothetical protein
MQELFSVAVSIGRGRGVAAGDVVAGVGGRGLIGAVTVLVAAAPLSTATSVTVLVSDCVVVVV